uniref:Glutamine amidotransferase domain-containing protein n=1 Tax=Polyblepharides amylifera TaxID=1486889 RepID=A0A7R9XMZ1_9CHLO|mmetsp:Transcript_1237/g.1757  ORF Transcript_1237/g.1757 Transcript_1237/m.1757 type:complete len:278 (+) Transcript_1237:53-886(+)
MHTPPCGPAPGGSAPARLDIAVLNCPGSGTEKYHVAFERWINSVTDQVKVSWTVFEADQRQLPPTNANFYGYIISGSKHGVYEDIPWIQELCTWVCQAHSRRCKLLGICFGHQVVAKALGGEVQPNPAGFVIGRYPTSISMQAREYFQSLGSWEDLQESGQTASQLTMNFVHGDYVVQVPSSLRCMGGTPLSPHNGLFNGSNILTFQGHPEFSAENVSACLGSLLARGVLPPRLPVGTHLAQVKESLEGRVDSKWIGSTVLRFFQDIDHEEPVPGET